MEKTQTWTVTEEKKRRNMVQDHYTFTNSAGQYLVHATITTATTGKNITGRISGTMFLVEKEIQRNVHWLVCLLHMNELHLRNVLLIHKTKKINS